ncbi:hypothetical protein ACFQV4_12955 [Streptomyces thermocarboxydus]
MNDHAWAYGCGHDYVVAKPPARVPPPPAPQDARTWAATQGAVHGKETLVELSVQEVRHGRRTHGPAGPGGRPFGAGARQRVRDGPGCGGALTPRYFDVDLDKDRPIARAVAGTTRGRRSRRCGCRTGCPRPTPRC